MINTPVLFIVFNRPETTSKVFEAIRAVKPKQLFIAADGPRPNKPVEKQNTVAVLKIVDNIDWDCEVKRLYQQQNLGCGKAVSSAINWFFAHVEKGIILEDDTLPNESFFIFCEILLEKYKDDNRIGHINGSNFQMGKQWGKASYYYSYYPTIWGWATWRRAWHEYEYKMESFPHEAQRTSFWKIFDTNKEKVYWKNIFQKMFYGFESGINALDTWDYQWIFTCLKNQWIVITPNVNLISNIGFGIMATHTKTESKVSYLPSERQINLIHPLKVKIYKGADQRLFNNYFSSPLSIMNILRNIVYKTMPSSIVSKLRWFRRKYFSYLQ